MGRRVSKQTWTFFSVIAFGGLLLVGTLVFRDKSTSRGLASKEGSTSSSCDSKFFDRENLQKLTQEGGVSSITELVKLAPDCFKLNQVTIYRSESLQCATPKAPRVILYLNDKLRGYSLCSFNSGIRTDYAEFYNKDPKIDCHEDSLECVHFNSGTNRFEFYEAKEEKSISQSRIVVSKVNPKQCMSCHRGTEPYLGAANPRPNIENYPVWPGFYGSLHDDFFRGDKGKAVPGEKEKYIQEYLPYKKENPRYSALPNFFLGSDLESNPEFDNHKPTTNLQNHLEGLNHRRIAAEFTDPAVLKRIWPFRYAILGALACDDDIQLHDFYNKRLPAERKFSIESFLPNAVKEKLSIGFTQFASKVLRMHQENLKKMLRIQKQAGPFHHEQFEEQLQQDLANDPEKPYQSYDIENQNDFWNAVRLGFLAVNLGLPVEGWSMTFSPTLDFEAGARNFKQVAPYLAPWLLNKENDADLSLTIDIHLSQPVDSVQCEKLRIKSLAALAHPDALKALDKTDTSTLPATDANSTKSPPQSLSNCIACHVNGSAPRVPFDDSSLLKTALNAAAKTRPDKKLFREAIDRIDSGNMPPNANLSDSDKAALKSYFEQILKQ